MLEDPYGQTDPSYQPADVTAIDEQMRAAEIDRMLAEEVAKYDAEQAAAEDEAIRQSLTPMGMAGSVGRRASQIEQDAIAPGDPLMAEVQMPSRPNPVAPIRKAYTDETLGQRTGEVDPYGNPVRAGGNLEAIQQANVDVVGAQAYEQLAMADAYAREAGAQQAQIDAQQAKLVRDEQRRARAIEAQDHVFAQVQDATDKLLRTPDVDQGRYWASRKGYQKVAWAISAIADGMRGLDPMGALNRAIEQDIAVQQANYAQRRGDVEAAQGQLGAARSLYADLRQTIGDEEVAANALRIARYEQAKAMVMAEQMRAGIPLTVAQGSAEIAELDQKIAEIRLQTSEKIALTPERVGGGRRPLVTGPMRRTLERREEGSLDEARALRAKGVDMASDAATQERAGEQALAVEGVKARGAASAKMAEGDADVRKQILQNSRDWGAVEQMIDDWEARNSGEDIPGTGLPWTGSSQERIENDSFDTLLPQMTVKAITGANFSEEQGEAAKRLASGAWHNMTDEAKRTRLRALKNLASAQRRNAARILGEDPDNPVSRRPVVQGPQGFSTFEPD